MTSSISVCFSGSLPAFLYSTVIIFICFMLCWKIKYDDDDDDDDDDEVMN